MQRAHLSRRSLLEINADLLMKHSTEFNTPQCCLSQTPAALNLQKEKKQIHRVLYNAAQWVVYDSNLVSRAHPDQLENMAPTIML
jgi:hypothetical protein